MNLTQPVCPVCGNGNWFGPPRLIGKAFIAPRGYVDLAPAQAQLVRALLAKEHTTKELALALNVHHSNWKSRIESRMTDARQLLRVVGWTIGRRGEKHRMEEL